MSITMDARRALGCSVAAAALAAGAWAAEAPAKPGMTWMAVNLPPGSMPVAGALTDGIMDTIAKMVFDDMPEFEHRISVVNPARAMANLAEGKPSCILSAVASPERRRLGYIAVAVVLPPMQVVARDDVVKSLPKNSKGEVLPAALLERTDLRGLLVAQRSYSAALDAELHKRRNNASVKSVVAVDGVGNIFKMLDLNRGDYTFEYDFVWAYNHFMLAKEGEAVRLKALPVAGAEPVEMGFACPHTDWGRRVILRIDGILAQASKRPEYLGAMTRWLTPESRQRYKSLLPTFIRQRQKLTSPEVFPAWPAPAQAKP